MRILILTPFPPDGIGGAETFVKELIKEISKENEITLCTLKIRHGKPWQGTSLKNIVSVFPKMATYSFILNCLKTFDIIHAQGLIAGLVAVLLKRIFHVRVYITLLALYDFDTQKGLVNRMAKFVLNNCDLIFVEGKNGAKEVEGLIGRDVRIRIFNHWCDQEIFRPSEDRQSEKIRILFIGRPIPEKGKHIIQHAERTLSNSKLEFIYVENVPYENLPKYYQMADIVVVPSLYSEGFSRVVCEAASCGCAVIASNKGSLPEMVNHFGITCAPEEIGSRIKDVLFQDYYKDMGKRSYLYAKDNFSAKNCEVFLEAYR